MPEKFVEQYKLNESYAPLKRALDLALLCVTLPLLILPIFLVSLAVRVTSSGPVIYWSDRVGRHNVNFKMPKFRTLRVGTPLVATHLLIEPNQYLTPIGSFLRKSSLDELPQLWSIARGQMSFVGPRPALFNQNDLICLRTEHGVQLLMPGLTGWSQVNGRDELPNSEKVRLDVEYLRRCSFLFDLRILFITIRKVVLHNDVAH